MVTAAGLYLLLPRGSYVGITGLSTQLVVALSPAGDPPSAREQSSGFSLPSHTIPQIADSHGRAIFMVFGHDAVVYSPK